MPDEKKYTEREKMQAMQQAFLLGAQRWATDRDLSIAKIREDARYFYPLPKVSRPRVAIDKDRNEWRITKRIEIRLSTIANHGFGPPMGDALALQLEHDPRFREDFASLLLDPTEEVDNV